MNYLKLLWNLALLKKKRPAQCGLCRKRSCENSCANDMGDTVGLSREGYLKIGWDDPQIGCHYYFSDPSVKTVIAQELEDAYESFPCPLLSLPGLLPGRYKL